MLVSGPRFRCTREASALRPGSHWVGLDVRCVVHGRQAGFAPGRFGIIVIEQAIVGIELYMNRGAYGKVELARSLSRSQGCHPP